MKEIRRYPPVRVKLGKRRPVQMLLAVNGGP